MRVKLVLILFLVTTSGCLSLMEDNEETPIERIGANDVGEKYFENIGQESVKDLVHPNSPDRKTLSFLGYNSSKLNTEVSSVSSELIFFDKSTARINVKGEINNKEFETTMNLERHDQRWKVYSLQDLSLVIEIQKDRSEQIKSPVDISVKGPRISEDPNETINNYFDQLDKKNYDEKSLKKYIHPESPWYEEWVLEDTGTLSKDQLREYNITSSDYSIIYRNDRISEVIVDITYSDSLSEETLTTRILLIGYEDRWGIVARHNQLQEIVK